MWLIERFADQADVAHGSTYQALLTIFHEQCEVDAGQVTVRSKTGGNCMQNPSDPDATYDAHKGAGYQVQISETCSPENDVQLLTAALPQTACEYDGHALVPILEQLDQTNLLPQDMLADGHYGSDENVQAAATYDIELVAPIPGRDPLQAADALTIDDFASDERTGRIEACPAGHTPLSVEQNTVTHDDGTTTTTTRVDMPPEACAGCPFFTQCPIDRTRDGEYTLDFTDQQQRTASRRREQETPPFQERYAKRSGIESTNSGLKGRLGLGQLRVRGRDAVFRVILLKLAGWNVLRAAASGRLRARIAARMAALLEATPARQARQLHAQIWQLLRQWKHPFGPFSQPTNRPANSPQPLSRKQHHPPPAFCR